MDNKNTVQSIERACEILEIMSTGGADIGITEIAEQAGLPLPTVHRVLSTLAARGYVFQTPRRRYALGAALIPIGEHARAAMDGMLGPQMHRVVEQVRESVSVAVLDRDKARYIAHETSNRSLRMFTRVGVEVMLHATGVGKAILASMPEAESEALVRRLKYKPLTQHSISNATELLEELTWVRNRGYALDLEEFELGVICVAMPIPGDTRMAMSVSGPASRMTQRVIEEIVPVLHEATQSVAETLSTNS